ncbi:MAG: glycosyltransferase family 2 protein [Chloroflexi bacterium]|nr:glycosyltransferase family 2 protein [Chloroflexota bacterium]MQC16823.1 glycosyltransferase family 2 protein [Chloroflexota bacterium]
MASVDLVIPCYNEEHVLAGSVERLLAWCDGHPEHTWRVVVANNASTDRTLEVARELEQRYPGRVVAQHIPVKGRGIALRITWLTSEADVMAYMDVDLSTDIEHIPALVDPIARGEVDLAYGTRLHRESQTKRSLKRETTSRGYVAILRLVGLRVTDAQCGFKAISREAARALLPLVEDTQWFWDTELLWIAQANGYRMREVPVRWDEDPDTRVKIIKTATDDLKGIWRMRRQGLPRVVGRHRS